MAESFSNVIENLITQLTGYQPLMDFCASGRKQLHVLPALKKRREVSSSQMPIIMVARPSTQGHDYRRTHNATHRVRLYAGFKQNDHEKAVLEQIRFEELIIDAVMNDDSLGDIASRIKIVHSANDEGRGHPGYFTVIDMDVDFERDLSDVDALPGFDEKQPSVDTPAKL